jgi:hypothetical protein
MPKQSADPEKPATSDNQERTLPSPKSSKAMKPSRPVKLAAEINLRKERLQHFQGQPGKHAGQGQLGFPA